MYTLIVIILVVIILILYLRSHLILVRFVKLHPNAYTPTRAYHRSAAFDLYSIQDITVPPSQWREIRTGIAIEPFPHIHFQLFGIPITITPLGNVVGRIYTRSSQGKKGLRVHLGIIDCDFRGEITVFVFNHGTVGVRFRPGDKIAQIGFSKVPTTILFQSKKLGKSLRGARGFGSTGR